MKVVGAAIVGIVAFALTWLTTGRVPTSAEVRLVLDQDEVVWPHHDSVRFEAAGALENDPDVLELIENEAGPDATIDAQLFSGQSHMLLTVSAADPDSAMTAADAAASWISDRSLITRQKAADDRLAVLERHRSDLLDELAATAEDSPRQAALAGRVADLDAEIDAERTNRELLRPQIRAAGPAEPTGGDYSPWLAMASGLAAAFALLLVVER